MTDFNEAARLLGQKGGQVRSQAKSEAAKKRNAARTLKPIEDVECTCHLTNTDYEALSPQSHARTCRRYRTWYQRQRRAEKKGEEKGQ